MTQKQLEESVAYLKGKGFNNPEVGIVLGTGLGDFVEVLEDPIEAYYNHIPFFPLVTVAFHAGKLIFGTLKGKKVVVMQGRFHLYEGYDFQDVTYPIRVMQLLGIKNLVISNAGGALNPEFKKGDLMLLDDHINMQGGSPLAFNNVERFGERFVDMSAPYDAKMNAILKAIGQKHQIELKSGVYAAVLGPQLETRAEYRMLRLIGADAVGMSTVPEVIVANHLKLPVIALSVLTDECNPDNLQTASINDIVSVAKGAKSKISLLFGELISQI